MKDEAKQRAREMNHLRATSHRDLAAEEEARRQGERYRKCWRTWPLGHAKIKHRPGCLSGIQWGCANCGLVKASRIVGGWDWSTQTYYLDAFNERTGKIRSDWVEWAEARHLSR